MAAWAVGDVQGCLEPFERLLRVIGFDEARDELWLVGDLVNRGPDSLGVLRRVHASRRACRVVLGNHDRPLLAVACGAVAGKKSDTFGDILEAPDSGELLAWLRKQPLLHYDEKRRTVMTHAGIPPQWTLGDARRLAREVEDTLRSGNADDYFRAMYGNEPACWDEELTGTARLRLITNFLTRMRFVDRRGTLDLATKEGLGSAPKGYRPWFDFPSSLPKDTRIVFGHWAALEGRCEAANVEALDTGCVWGRQLTALNLDTGFRVACGCAGAARG